MSERGYFRFPADGGRRDGRHDVGFADLSVEQVASVCGLTVAQATLAKRRDYDEPFDQGRVEA